MELLSSSNIYTTSSSRIPMSPPRRFSSTRDAMRSLMEETHNWSSSLSPADLIGGDEAEKADAPPILGDASFVPPFECFATRVISPRQLKEHTETRLRGSDRLIGRVKTTDAACARVRLLCGDEAGRKMDLRTADMQVIVPVSSLSRRPQVGDLVRVIVECPQPLRCSLDEAMDSIAGPPSIPPYLVEDEAYSDWTKGVEMILNRHAEEALGSAGRATLSFLPDVQAGTRLFIEKKRRKKKEAADLVTQGITAMRKGEKDEAWSLLREAAEVWPRCADAYVALGALLVNDGRMSDAEQYFKRAIEYEPKHANARLYYKQVVYATAKVHEKESRWSDAADCYERAVREGLDVEESQAAAERCRKEYESRSRRSPSVEEIVPSTVYKRPRISHGVKKTSDCVARSEGRNNVTVVGNGNRKRSNEMIHKPQVPVLKQEERKRLSDLEQLHAMLKNEAGKKK